MKPRMLILVFALLAFGELIYAQPAPGDVYKEYIWLPTMVKEKEQFLRVGGRLDYKISTEHMPTAYHKEGFLLLEDSLDLNKAIKVELTLEMVQSHEDTKGLAIQINQSDWIQVPNLTGLPRPQSDYMLHAYPNVDLPLGQFKEGHGNRFKLQVDTNQRWHWPQNIFYGLIFRVYYQPDKLQIEPAQIQGTKSGSSITDSITFSLANPDTDQIKEVDYLGYYTDYNWEGDGNYTQWHGHPHRGKLRNHIGGSTVTPFKVTWNTEWLPDQSTAMKFLARVTLQNGLIYHTQAIEDVHLVRDYSIELCRPYHQPTNWVSRKDTFQAKFAVHGDLKNALAYQVAWRSWSPCYGRGVFINGHKIWDREDPCYGYAEHLYTLDQPHLLPGENIIQTGMTPLIDSQMVHGMEVQYPGIMVKVRYQHPLKTTIKVTEGYYESRPHYIISTPTAIYYYDRAGGGFSRIIDLDGKDWIDFKMKPWNQYPTSAASAFRGVSNFVFGSDDGGAGHPGHDQCSSELRGDHSIITHSLRGNWEWRWDFFQDHARVQMLKVDPNHPYWFLYEGTPGGSFNPTTSYFGTNKGGPHRDQLDYYHGDKMFDYWQWAYMGQQGVGRVLFLAQESKDDLSDTFSYLGNSAEGIQANDGMVVFGFGRAEGAKPLMKTPNTFYLGFIETVVENNRDHNRVEKHINGLLEMHD